MAEPLPRVEQEKTLVSWKAPARPFKPRGSQFLTVPMVTAILVGIILLLAGEWMLIAVVVALVFAYYVWTTVPPMEAEFLITTRGLRLHEQLYVWEVLTRWWMTDKWGQKILAVETPTVMVGRLLLPLGKTDEKEIIKEMEKYLLREQPADTTLDKMGKWLTEKFPLEETR
ncbi:MAG: hypothetical protein UX91_C0001G0137 [Candidatus Amesbacteria bacterium GW2011_GWB1_47_19]|nr:MAG: hypothetical protein UW51_C0001G0137 [Candidatus Amesbacteria bacterium GW2011_GWA1_44_24]KKU32149.1 MAG: hypothetical protein UX46_C0001G0136 [Candidatus Amesbacteria bacterium GW2011_GWC1_46_24]KKU67833.1 MAG: hypothetical protein UX91_C0001G0137 [Candidatus Amesbacteria bacterium GW2011_GWB1_47_19]OGD05005.1 MAG: hypothetical protein A2379_03825 [Candidatus Amesbacteria bacterium RIFOXYB1_FULL_47_13]HBC72431.1 hypothetical protein [Candidatus Amesbacteria bacterium]